MISWTVSKSGVCLKFDIMSETSSNVYCLLQHTSAAQIYVDIGAVEFLSQLRRNVEPSLHGLIDSILDNLFHLPTVDSAQRECLYQHHYNTREYSLP